MIIRSHPGGSTRRLVTLVAVAILVGTVAAMVGCRSREAQSKRELSLGINDYKDAKYESAIRHFQRAVALDPRSAEARKYLVAIASPPNTPDTRGYAEEAIREYEQVLKSSPDQLEAVEGLAYLHFQLAHYDQGGWLTLSQLTNNGGAAPFPFRGGCATTPPAVPLSKQTIESRVRLLEVFPPSM